MSDINSLEILATSAVDYYELNDHCLELKINVDKNMTEPIS